MKKIKNILKKLKKLPLRKKIQIATAAALTISLAVAIPVYAWFNNQKKAAV